MTCGVCVPPVRKIEAIAQPDKPGHDGSVIVRPTSTLNPNSRDE
jgi:hypothetical protein